MSTIGTFTKNGDRFDGYIRTLNLNLPSVSFVPVDRRGNDNAPNYRAFSGQAEFGAAWTKESKNRGRIPLGAARRSRHVRSDFLRTGAGGGRHVESGLVPAEQITRLRRGRSRPLLSSFKPLIYGD